MFEALGGDAPTVPAEGSAVRRAGGEWRDSGTPGFPVQQLLEDAEAGLRTWLMRIEAGADAPRHSHEEIEQIYVIEGHFSDGEADYGPGDYIIRAAGAEHLTASSEGALVLVMYSAAAESSS